MMEGKVWRRPLTQVQKFEPNEYCTTCGTQYGDYLFECNAPAGKVYYYTTDGNVAGGVHYWPCADRNHTVDRDSDFPNGFIDYNNNGREDSGEAVIVWLEKAYGFVIDHHATTNMDRESWETVKS